jgi:hypothetical protein
MPEQKSNEISRDRLADWRGGAGNLRSASRSEILANLERRLASNFSSGSCNGSRPCGRYQPVSSVSARARNTSILQLPVRLQD